jgi:exosortase
MKPRTIIIPLIIIAILSLFYWPTYRWLVNSWLSNDYYSHGFLVPLVSAFFIWTKREQLKKAEPSTFGAAILALGALLYILGSLLDIRSLTALSLPIVISAISLSFLGIRATRAIIFPLGFLIFMIPPPFIQDLGYHLQKISINYSTWLLDVFGLPVKHSGPEIYIGDARFTVGLACSGINTLIALLTLAAIYTYMLSGPLYKRAGLFVLAFPIAIIANVLRISSIIMVAHYHNAKTAAGWYHDLSSPLFFFVAFLLLILVGWILRCRLNYDILRKR